MMVGRGLGGTGTVSGTGTVVVPGRRYWGDARQVVTTFFRVWVLRWCSFWFLKIEAWCLAPYLIFHLFRNNPDCSFF